MSHYKLDVSKWRSGEYFDPNCTGEGDASMLNEEGYMCCLGQFAKCKGVSDEELSGTDTPEELYTRINRRYDQAFVHNAKDTKLTNKLIKINDATHEFSDLTPKQRVDAIRAELKKHGHTLSVIGYKSLK